MQPLAGPITWSSLVASVALHGVAFGALVWITGGDGSPATPQPGPGGYGAPIAVRLVAGADDEAAPVPAPAMAAASDLGRAVPEAPPVAARIRRHDARASAAAPASARPLAVAVPSASTGTVQQRPLELAAAPAPPQRIARAEPTGLPVSSTDPRAGLRAEPKPASRAGEASAAGGRRAGAAHRAGPSGDAGLAPDRPARPLSSIRPRYPESARRRGREADVVVDVHVSAAGRVEEALLVSGAGEPFDAAALEAVRAARFAPAERAGEHVASRVALRLHFRLDR